VAVGPEARTDPQGFRHAVRTGAERLIQLEQERKK
jgi:hypothetical protein